MNCLVIHEWIMCICELLPKWLREIVCNVPREMCTVYIAHLFFFDLPLTHVCTTKFNEEKTCPLFISNNKQYIFQGYIKQISCVYIVWAVESQLCHLYAPSHWLTVHDSFQSSVSHGTPSILGQTVTWYIMARQTCNSNASFVWYYIEMCIHNAEEGTVDKHRTPVFYNYIVWYQIDVNDTSVRRCSIIYSTINYSSIIQKEGIYI